MKIISQYGRSMVEMLGVLAIVGVLSVGAIAGYSTAMQKYRINKFIDEQNHFIRDLMEYEGLRKINKTNTQVKITDYIQKLNILPSDASINNSNNIAFKNVVVMPYVSSGKIVLDYYLHSTAYGTHNTKLCYSMISDLFVPLKESIDYVLMYFGDANESGSMGSRVYGNNSCTSSSKCLKDFTQTDVHNLCDECDGTALCVIAVKLW